jgi:hypothetical protein
MLVLESLLRTGYNFQEVRILTHSFPYYEVYRKENAKPRKNCSSSPSIGITSAYEIIRIWAKKRVD